MTPKIISYDVEIKSTSKLWVQKVPEVYTNDSNSVEIQFNLIDCTEAELLNSTAQVLLYMRDGSFFQNTGVDVTRTGTTFSYTLKDNEGNHQGLTETQLVLTIVGSPNEDYASQMYQFKIKNGLGNNVPVETFIQTWETLTTEANAFIAQMETDVQEFDVALENGVLATNIAAKLNNLETTYSPRLLSAEQQLEQIQAREIPPSPTHSMFGVTGIIDVNYGGAYDETRAGEPFVVYDEDNGVWRMFYFGSTYDAVEGTKVYCLDATSNSKLGPWTKRNIDLSGTYVGNRHKMAVLVDVHGKPVKVNGKYHAYVVGYATKHLWHWETTNLASTWTETGAAILKGFANNGTDGFGIDAPCAIWDGTQVILYYMAMPLTAQPDFGLAHRINRATSPNATAFTYDGVACLPSTDTTSWFYGWLGGAQIRKAKDGSYWIALNASDTRPVNPGEEPDHSLWGFATAKSLTDPWIVKKTAAIQMPYKAASVVMPYGKTILEYGTSIWRPFLVYSDEFKKWCAYYNASATAAGAELNTHAWENVQIFDNSADPLLTITTVEQQIPGTAFKVSKGHYKLDFNVNLMGDIAGGLPKLDIQFKAYYNTGTPIVMKDFTIFIGSYAYENQTLNLQIPILSTDENAQIYMTVKCTSGTPLAGTKIRRSKIMLTKI